MRRVVALLILVAPAALWPALAQQPPVTAIVGVTVVPMDRERTLADHTVIVRGDRIEAVGPVTGVAVPAGATRIEGRGRFLLPGLAEMHGHLGPQEAMNLRVLELNVLRGITTIRGMLGHPSHLPLRARVMKGELLGPAIYTSGPSFNGNSAPTPEAAAAMVAEQKAAGYDFLKIHPGVPLAAFEGLTTAARRAGLSWQGHVPAEVGLARALAGPYRAIDHLDGYVEALAGLTPGPGAPDPGFFGFKLVDRVEASRIPALAAETKKAGVAIVPTEMVAHMFLSPEPPAETLAQPHMRYVPAAMREGWDKQKAGFVATHGTGTPESRERYFGLRRRLILELHKAGVPILLGADSPQLFAVPGFATHQELALLVAAGLTPFHALQAGTTAVAAFLGAAATQGTVARGQRADLVLVDAHPLERIEHASRISGVMVRGRWLGAGEIASRLEALAVP